MTSATRPLLWRTLIGAAVLGVLLLAAAFGLVLYANGRLADAEERHLAELRTHLAEPAPSSAESIAFTVNFLGAARQAAEAWPTEGREFDVADPRVPAGLEPQVEVFLAAADTPLAHEPLLRRDERGLELLRAARLLDGAARQAAADGDEARQARCAEALAAMADALHRQTSLIGLLLGTAVEQIELGVLQRLVEAPATSPAALARCAALLDGPAPSIHASFAAEALALLEFEPPPDQGWAAPLLAPLHDAMSDLLKARTLQRFAEAARELDQPLTGMLASQPAPLAEPSRLEVITAMILPNIRDAFVKAKTVREIRQLGRDALAARRDGRDGQLTRPEVVAALRGYWRLDENDPLSPGSERILELLTWRVPAAG